MNPANLTIGIEEEYLLLDPSTGRPSPRGQQVRRLAAAHPDVADAQVEPELLEVQVEVATPVCDSLGPVREHLGRLRRELADAGREAGCALVGVGAASRFGEALPPTSEKERYQRMHERAPRLVDEMLLNGMHVHLGPARPGDRVRLLNRLRPWLPVFVALAANSPFWDGADSGFASWRTVHFTRWPVSGPPPVVRDESDYEQRIDAIIGVGALVDRGQLYWQARLSQNYPTVEVRVADVQLTVSDAVLLAGLLRGVAAHLLEDPAPPPDVPDELLRTAVWQAARDELAASLWHPLEGRMRPAADVVAALEQVAMPALHTLGDAALVQDAVERRRQVGSGAARQRERYASGGLPGVLDLLTEEFLG